MLTIENIIDEAHAIAGSYPKLAAQIGSHASSVQNWRAGRKPCPAKYVLALATVAGRDPIQTALDLYAKDLENLIAKSKRRVTHGAQVTLSFLVAVGAGLAASIDARQCIKCQMRSYR